MSSDFETVPGGNIKDAAMMALYNGTRIDFRKYRSFETLPQQAWEYIDETLIRTAKENLVGIADLQSRPGTSINFDGMTASVYTKKRVSEVGAANIAVSPDTSANSAILDMSDVSVPMVVTYKDFHINIKQMAMASRIGLPLEASLVEEATRSVSRTLEDTLFNGNVKANGATAYGYTTFPDRQTYTIPISWATALPSLVLADVNNMISLSMQANYFGPWMLYIPWQYQVRLNEDYLSGSTGDYPVSGSIQDRLMTLPNLLGIKVSNYLANDNIVLVEMTSDTVQLINGMPMRVVAWEPPGTPNWEHKFKVMTMSVPMLISDYNGGCGIIHGSV